MHPTFSLPPPPPWNSQQPPSKRLFIETCTWLVLLASAGLLRGHVWSEGPGAASADTLPGLCSVGVPASYIYLSMYDAGTQKRNQHAEPSVEEEVVLVGMRGVCMVSLTLF